MYLIAIHWITVKRTISEIILNITFLFMYVSSCSVDRTLLSTSEIFSITTKNIRLFVIDTQTTAIMLLVYEKNINQRKAINNVCETTSTLKTSNNWTGKAKVNIISYMLYIIAVNWITVKRIISKIILNINFLFMYVSSCIVC